MKRVITLLIAIALMICMAVPVSADTMPALKVTLAADSYSVESGDEFKVTMGFENASAYPYGLAAFRADLRYDSTLFAVKKVDVAAPRANVMNNSLDGEFRSLYTFTSATRKPGFNTDGPYMTVTFEVLDGASGTTDISVTFDSVTVTDYDSPQLNFTVGFNSPSVRVNILGDESSTPPASSTVSTESQAPSTDPSVSSDTTPVVSTPSGSANDAPSSSGSSTDTKFEDVTQSGQDFATDKFNDKGEVIEQTESKGQNPDSSNDDKDNDDGDKNGTLVVTILLICAAAVLVIFGAIIIILFAKNKKGKK